jgi:hypothetical protein
LESIPGLLKRLQIRAQMNPLEPRAAGSYYNTVMRHFHVHPLSVRHFPPTNCQLYSTILLKKLEAFQDTEYVSPRTIQKYRKQSCTRQPNRNGRIAKYFPRKIDFGTNTNIDSKFAPLMMNTKSLKYIIQLPIYYLPILSLLSLFCARICKRLRSPGIDSASLYICHT